MKHLFCILLITLSTVSFADYTAEDFFKDSQFEEIYLSPEGTYLAAVVDREKASGIAILRTKDNSLYNFIESSQGDLFRSVEWLSEQRLEVSIGKKLGAYDEPAHKGYLTVNIDGSRLNKGSQGYVLDHLPDNKKHRLTYFYEDGYPVIYKAFKKNSEIRQIDRIPFRGQFVADNNAIPRIAYHDSNKDGDGEIFYRDSEDSEWVKIFDYKHKQAKISFLSFTRDNKKVVVYDGRADSKGYYYFHTDTKEFELLWKHDSNNNVRNIYDGRFNGSKPIGVEIQPGKYQLAFFDETDDYSNLLIQLEKSFPNNRLVPQEMTADGKFSLIYITGDKTPGDYYLLDVEKKNLRYLVSKRPWLKTDKLSPMTPVNFEARDGLNIHGYLTKPLVSKEKLPMVVMIHGGPFGIRDNWGYKPEVQFLANSGYAVLQINYRGSGGYGLDFQYDAYGKVGKEMQDDITDGTLWAIEKGYADKDKICIFGASYGAYSAMMGAIQRPDLYKCAIGSAGLYDIGLQRKSIYYKRNQNTRKFYQDAWKIKDKDFIKERSPLYLVEKLQVPVFLIHGKKDSITPFKHFEKMTEALEEHNKEFETLVKPKEMHGFYSVENKLEYYERMTKFLEKHIGKK